jgi:hypothetical protein
MLLVDVLSEFTITLCLFMQTRTARAQSRGLKRTLDDALDTKNGLHAKVRRCGGVGDANRAAATALHRDVTDRTADAVAAAKAFSADNACAAAKLDALVTSYVDARTTAATAANDVDVASRARLQEAHAAAAAVVSSYVTDGALSKQM